MEAPRGPRLPSPASVQHELRRIIREAHELTILAQACGPLYEETYEASYSPFVPGGDPGNAGRGRIARIDPTGESATNGHLRTLRSRAAKMARLLSDANRLLSDVRTEGEIAFRLVFDEETWQAYCERRAERAELDEWVDAATA